MDMLFGVGSIANVARDGKRLEPVVKLQRGVKAGGISSSGSVFKSNDDKLQSIMRGCM